jgi:DNA-binding beta-propeller fold protein YncE
MASGFVLVQPGYSTIIRSNNGSNTSDNNLDVSKEVFVVDYANIRIQKFTNNGDFITMWGSKGSKNGQLDRPHDIAIDSSGNNVYVAEQGNFQIQKFTADGKFITKWGTEGADDDQFQDPHSVAVY